MTKSSLKHHCNCRFFSIFRLEIAARWQLFYVVDMGGLQYERIWDLSGGKGWGLKKFSYDQNTNKLLTVFQKKRIDAKKDKDVEGNAMEGNAVEEDANAMKSMKKDDGKGKKADGKRKDKGKKADGKGKKDDGKGKKADGKGKKADGKKANAKMAVKKDDGKGKKAMKKNKGKKAMK